ncbi:hypothetical protein EG328_009534 [Venturia inaequalis]|uniref:Uncharacterized protein n=1 Tax=Venturia inaequalis TaxID=5025 RepID=A0A8H3VB38_VENIN|nr:hypothetical protein EG328_009534 [Venturia inaequalis]
MHYSSSILLIGAIAPLSIATPVPHFRLPFRRSTGDIRPWDGAIERDWNGTLDLASAEIPKKSTVESPPVVLHQTLDEAHPYFSFLRNLVKRKSHHVTSLPTTDDSSDLPRETAKAPIPVPLAVPPPLGPPGSPPAPVKFVPEIFDPEVDSVKRAAPESAPASHSEEEKRQLQWPPSWPSASGVGGAPSTPDVLGPFSSDDEDEEEGLEASLMPPGHPIPESVPLPLYGWLGKRSTMTVEQLREVVRNKIMNSNQDVEDMKRLVGEVDLAEKKEQEATLAARDQESAPKLVKRNNKFAGSDIVTPAEAAQAWKQTLRTSKSERGKADIKGMETWVHEEPYAELDFHDLKIRKYNAEMDMRKAKGGLSSLKKRSFDTDINTNINNNINTDINTDINTEINTDINTEINTDINTDINVDVDVEMDVDVEVDVEEEDEILLDIEKRDTTKPHLEKESDAKAKGIAAPLTPPKIEVVKPATNVKTANADVVTEAVADVAKDAVADADIAKDATATPAVSTVEKIAAEADNRRPNALNGPGGYGPGGYGPGGYGPGGYGPNAGPVYYPTNNGFNNGGGFNNGAFVGGGGFNNGGFNGGYNGGGRGGYGGGGRGYKKMKV